MSDSPGAFPEEDRKAHVGWLVGGLVILAAMAVGAGFWFAYHP